MTGRGGVAGGGRVGREKVGYRGKRGGRGRIGGKESREKGTPGTGNCGNAPPETRQWNARKDGKNNRTRSSLAPGTLIGKRNITKNRMAAIREEQELSSSLKTYNEDSMNRVRMLEGKANLIRKHAISMIHRAGSGHPGGSLSAADILATLYFDIMRHDPERPDWPDRDRLVLSKGHAAPALYAALAEAGYFPVDELLTLRQLGSRLQGHPSMRHLPGVDMSTGSLGQGLSAAVGMALGGKLDRKDHYVYVIIGDGETQEGNIWEAAMSAAHYKLDHLIAFLDRNRLQIDGRTSQVMSIAPVKEKWEAFGWNVVLVNGHDIAEIIRGVEEVKRSEGKPSIIIAHTVKGKGVSFMEGSLNFHGKAPNDEQYEIAMRELSERGVSC